MDALIIDQTDILVDDWRSGQRRYDGLIYLMFRYGHDDEVVPLYVGKAETLGKRDGNRSANLRNLRTDQAKFARWGDGYAYHFGDLSAVALPGHDPAKRTLKYSAWADALFVTHPDPQPRLRTPAWFWTKAWRLIRQAVMARSRSIPSTGHH